MTQQNLHVLFVEASQDDLQHTLTLLEQNGFLIEYLRVENADAMQAALLGENWDIVLCSYNPPAFGGLEALTLMQSLGIYLPFLFLAHNSREENIIQAIQAGAGDYIFKGNMKRLVPAIKHYLQQATLRREHGQMLRDLKDNQTRLNALISNIPGMAYQLLQTGTGHATFPYVSDGCQTLLGISAQKLEQDPGIFSSLLHSDDLDSYNKAMLTSELSLSFVYWEGRLRPTSEGDIKWVNLRCSPRKLPQGVQWEGVMFNITERKLAEIEIQRSQQQLRELSAHIQDVREQERLALAREVHDDMGSMLTAIKLDIAWLASKLDPNIPTLSAKISDIDNLVTRCTAVAGNIARNLRPSTLDNFGIVAAIEIEATEFRQRTGYTCVIDAIDAGTPVDSNVAITLFRIFQETLNNIMKHAQASDVQIKIHNNENGIALMVKDNGCGLDDKDRQKPRSFGLRGIQERVKRFSGSVLINGSSTQGTSIEVNIPHVVDENSILQTHQQTLF